MKAINIYFLMGHHAKFLKSHEFKTPLWPIHSLESLKMRNTKL